jgi:NAD(P)-dependent dehydrogenase (short-subunit alcohol dehydrogenase family)
MPTLSDKSVFITGSDRGIGKAIALAFANAGSRVAVHGLVTPDEAEAGLPADSHHPRRLRVWHAGSARPRHTTSPAPRFRSTEDGRPSSSATLATRPAQRIDSRCSVSILCARANLILSLRAPYKFS